MIFIGNLLLLLASLILIPLFNLLLFQKMPHNDGAVGYVWSILFLNVAFLACTALVAAIIGWKGGFAWVGDTGTSRFLLVLGGLLAAGIGAGICGLAKVEAGAAPGLIRSLSGFATVLIPVLMIAGLAALLNDSLRDAVPAAVGQRVLVAASALGALAVGAGVLLLIADASRNATAQLKANVEFEDSNHLRMLSEIDSCDVRKDMVFILVFTDANQSPDIRERALAKIKTRPDWQEELVRRLNNGWAEQAFTFLASNEVDDKSLFPEAVRQGILNQAQIFRENIRRSSHPSHFRPEQFGWEVERVLRTIEKFEGMGVDYRPAVRELRAAMDEPTDIQKPKFRYAEVLEEWLRKRE